LFPADNAATGSSDELQVSAASICEELLSVAIPPWQWVSDAIAVLTRKQVRAAQKGAQTGATRRASNVSRLTVTARQLLSCRRIAFLIYLSYATLLPSRRQPSYWGRGSERASRASSLPCPALGKPNYVILIVPPVRIFPARVLLPFGP
jgi:hypothetical protein